MRPESGIPGLIYDLLRLIRLVSERQPEATEEDMELYEEELDELEALVDQKYGAETGVGKEVGTMRPYEDWRNRERNLESGGQR